MIRHKDAQLALCVCGSHSGIPSDPNFVSEENLLDRVQPQTYLLPPLASWQPDDPLPMPALSGSLTPSDGYSTNAAIPSPPPATGLRDVLYSLWPLNIPSPELLLHLIETAFKSVPLVSRYASLFSVKLRQVRLKSEFV